MTIDYQFNPCRLETIPGLVQAYLNALSSPIDSFLEDHILRSEFYIISASGQVMGYTALHEQILLTQFYVEKPFLAQGQQIFQQLLQQFRPEAAFVPTCDELFLSHSLDQEAGVNKQAYFFQDCREIQVDHKLYQPGQFRLATPADRLEIEKISGDFFDHLAERIARGEIFVFMEKDVLLGAGIAEKGRLLKHVASIGMFTHEQHRQKGVGRSIIIHLKKWCYENGFLPVAGCWYYNFNSKRALESAGMVTRTRLLKINLAKGPKKNDG